MRTFTYVAALIFGVAAAGCATEVAEQAQARAKASQRGAGRGESPEPPGALSFELPRQARVMV
jgi:hypothetical protein